MTDRERLLEELRPASFAIASGISSIVNPDKLKHLGPVGDFGSLATGSGPPRP